jgi:hypothetical protein
MNVVGTLTSKHCPRCGVLTWGGLCGPCNIQCGGRWRERPLQGREGAGVDEMAGYLARKRRAREASQGGAGKGEGTT